MQADEDGAEGVSGVASDRRVATAAGCWQHTPDVLHRCCWLLKSVLGLAPGQQTLLPQLLRLLQVVKAL
jgi:hypothetical protein